MGAVRGGNRNLAPRATRTAGRRFSSRRSELRTAGLCIYYRHNCNSDARKHASQGPTQNKIHFTSRSGRVCILSFTYLSLPCFNMYILLFFFILFHFIVNLDSFFITSTCGELSHHPALKYCRCHHKVSHFTMLYSDAG